MSESAIKISVLLPATLALLLAGTHSFAVESDDRCAKVTCANHGVCVIKKNEPVCACDEGFAPDPTTGLSCQPTPAATPTPSPLVIFRQEQQEIQAALNLTEPPDSAYCLRYKARFPDSHCAHFWYDYYDRKKSGGLLFLIPGLLGIGGGVVMGLLVDPVAGVGVGGAGIILTTVGALIISRNARRVRHLSPLVQKYSSHQRRFSRYATTQQRILWQGATVSFSF